MNRNNLTIGLFGFGCVGYGLYEVLQQTPTFEARIKRICVKHEHKQRPIDLDYFTFNPLDILTDPSINTIVELIDNADEAFEIVKTAMQHGKAVVSANKKMIAEHFFELLELQRKYQVPLLYEAACCASIPIIRNLEEYYDNDLLESLEGIVNGSTNYILSKTAHENISYEVALKDAQQKGFAESNPILDTGGFDAKYKLCILIAHAFGVVLAPDDLYNIGIDGLGDLELKFAKEKGYKIKLVAHAEKTADGNIKALVIPKFVPATDPLYYVDDVFNGIKTKSFFSDVQFFSGKGAGAYPTASAVLSDISALSYDYRYEYKKLNDADKLVSEENCILKVFLRFNTEHSISCQGAFNSIYESFISVKSGYLIGIISLANIRRLKESIKDALSFVLFDFVTEE